MPRKKTRGDALTFRIPVHLDDVLTRLAERNNVPRQVMAEQILVDYLEGLENKPLPERLAQKVPDTSAASAMLADLNGP